jgi:fatty acid desaturase
MAVAVASTPTSTTKRSALDDAIRAIPAAWFRPSRAVYWADFLLSALIGWAAFAVAIAMHGTARVALLTLATAALYRAVLFIHEITHLASRDVPFFTLVWNALVGVPFLIPSFLYEGVHTDHHRQRCYGTVADPEYMPYGRRRPLLIVTSVAASLLAPVVFAFRFGVLAPLGWIVRPLGRAIDAHASALVINTAYVRRAPIGAAARIEEAGACLVAWGVFFLWWRGTLPSAAVVCWFVTMSAASFVNAVRTLAAHDYDNDGDELTMLEQLLDSRTLEARRRPGAAFLDTFHAVIAPVGLRYHALHHWIPSLPYHNLGRAHRRLVAALSADASYRETIVAGLTPAIRDLFSRSRTQSG